MPRTKGNKTFFFFLSFHTEISFSFSVVYTHKIALVGVNPGRMQRLILVANKLLLYYV